ncbi:hypothetical protein VMCG_10162 [Cytospora schulzeri]|uniref:Uncharacterized protein n=1 Tax=Cytospora schulzeri TaxID=448051 RepID=A0A423VCX8_9PEZI|nr:hypothetical protein VMCG_10162 [Valsa malicola]
MAATYVPLYAFVATVSSGNRGNTTTATDLAHRPGRILAIVFCSIFVGFILIALMRILFYKAAYYAASRGGHEDDSTHNPGSDGASVRSDNAGTATSRHDREGSIGWDIEQAWEEGTFMGGDTRYTRRGFLTRPRPTVLPWDERAGWKTPPPAYTPPPVYSSSDTVTRPQSVFEPRIGQFDRPSPV